LPDKRDYGDGLSDLQQELLKALRAAEQAAGHLSDGDFQSTCTVLSIFSAHPLERRDVHLVRGELAIRESKTEAGVRTVEVTPALRDELVNWLARFPSIGPRDLVFATLSGRPDNRNNISKRRLHPAIKRANERLAGLGIDPIGNVTPHGLRRTYATIHFAAGDDVAFTAAQLGHTDATFSMNVYTHAVKRRAKLKGV